MNKLCRLVDLDMDVLWRGSLLRLPAKPPYEEYVEFMVFETQKEETPYGLIISSGYKAGLILVYLPKESCSSGGGVERQWIIDNWSLWIYPDCGIEMVFYADNRNVDLIREM
ncbi:Imm45 family immunity protein [Aeromonas salmonicida]